MRSLVSSLEKPWQVINVVTGEVYQVAACNAEAAVLQASFDAKGGWYWDFHPLEVGERLTMLGNFAALTSSPVLEDIFERNLSHG